MRAWRSLEVNISNYLKGPYHSENLHFSRFCYWNLKLHKLILKCANFHKDSIKNKDFLKNRDFFAPNPIGPNLLQICLELCSIIAR